MTETKPIEATAGHYQAVMKETLVFDSHGHAKRMTDGGFNEQQAETLAAEQGDLLSNLASRQDMEAVRDDIETIKKNMATKDDLKNFATKQDLATFKKDLKNLVTNQERAMNKEFELVRKEIQLSAQTLKVDPHVCSNVGINA